MACLYGWIHGDAMRCQRLREAVASEFRPILHCDLEVGGLAASRDGAVDAEKRLVGLAIEA